MSEILDIVGKELAVKNEAIFFASNKVMKGTIVAFNKSGFVKLKDSLTGEEFVSKSPSTEIYGVPEDIDLNEAFGVDTPVKPLKKKHTTRDFDRELSKVKDVMGNGVIYGDKIILVHDNEVCIGRTFDVVENTSKITVNLNKNKQDVVIEADGTNIYLLKPDYYIKDKSAYE
jgi:uncharacterized Zn ribbon protein